MGFNHPAMMPSVVVFDAALADACPDWLRSALFSLLSSMSVYLPLSPSLADTCPDWLRSLPPRLLCDMFKSRIRNVG